MTIRALLQHKSADTRYRAKLQLAVIEDLRITEIDQSEDKLERRRNRARFGES